MGLHIFGAVLAGLLIAFCTWQGCDCIGNAGKYKGLAENCKFLATQKTTEDKDFWLEKANFWKEQAKMQWFFLAFNAFLVLVNTYTFTANMVAILG